MPVVDIQHNRQIADIIDMRWLVLLFVILLAAGVILFRSREELPAPPVVQKSAPSQSAEIPARPLTAAQRIEEACAKARSRFPPQRLALLVFKQERRLEVWGFQDGVWMQIKTYVVLAASGGAGPKLREGDRQVPEGVYRIVYLNPHSNYHLSMKIDYPNAFDRDMAKQDGRAHLGGDICIHGKDLSIGCIALGDPAIEEVYHLIERAGVNCVRVIIVPNDLRTSPPATSLERSPPWLSRLYQKLQDELRTFTRPLPPQ